jgi:tRNA dimethylallyltransferase
MNNVIFLMGPTASGKTDLAIELSKHITLDLISVDSALIYKDMNIGTAKPELEILKKYPHQLVDIITPEQSYNVADFAEDASKFIKQSFENKKTPLLVGGTSFYFKSLSEGLSQLPESEPEYRDELNQQLKKYGVNYLYQQLEKIDSIASKRINQNDSQRIMRGLEVFHSSGKTLTELQSQPKVNALQENIKKIILLPNRPLLHQRIEERFLKMLDDGFIKEVEELQQKYKLHNDLSSMRCVGYRQVLQYLDNQLSYDEMVQRGIIATRQLCKRQITWLNKEQDALVLEQADIAKILKFLK